MKKITIIAILCWFSTRSFAQLTNMPAMDKSPMDMSYYPTGYPVLKIQDKLTEPLVARVVYSRPQKNGRVVFGELVEYGKVWRLGANEATEIEFFRDIKIGNNKLKKGRYTLYAIPATDKWTLVFNKDTDTWGAFKYDPKKDVLRYDIKAEKLTDDVEAFTMYFEKAAVGINLIMAWDDMKATLNFSY